MKSGIYAIYDGRGGACLYVGSSTDVEARRRRHLSDIRRRIHHNPGLQKRFAKSTRNLLYVALEECPPDQLNEREAARIAELAPVFNRDSPRRGVGRGQAKAALERHLEAVRAAVSQVGWDAWRTWPAGTPRPTPPHGPCSICR